MLSKLIKSAVIIDPNKYHAQTLAQALTQEGVNALKHYQSATDGLEGLMLLTPDVVFIEQELDSGRDGVGLTREVRRHPEVRNRRAPLILMASRASRLTLAQTIECGANALMAKPIAPGTAAAVVRKVIENPRPFVDAPGYVGPCRRWGLNRPLDPCPKRRASDLAAERAARQSDKDALVALLAQEGALALLSADADARTHCRAAAQRLEDQAAALEDHAMRWAAQAAVRLLAEDAPESWRLQGAALFEALALFRVDATLDAAASAKRDQLGALLTGLNGAPVR